jgi:hypothetical protein
VEGRRRRTPWGSCRFGQAMAAGHPMPNDNQRSVIDLTERSGGCIRADVDRPSGLRSRRGWVHQRPNTATDLGGKSPPPGACRERNWLFVEERQGTLAHVLDRLTANGENSYRLKHMKRFDDLSSGRTACDGQLSAVDQLILDELRAIDAIAGEPIE